MFAERIGKLKKSKFALDLKNLYIVFLMFMVFMIVILYLLEENLYNKQNFLLQIARVPKDYKKTS